MVSRILKYFVLVPALCWLLIIGALRLPDLLPELFGLFRARAVTPLPPRAAPLPLLTRDPANLFYEVTFANPVSHTLTVSGEFHSLGGEVGVDASAAHEIAISDVVLHAADGGEIPLQEDEGVFRGRHDAAGWLKFSYRATLGAMGRHGHQGNFDWRFASFDGRIYALPLRNEQIQYIQVRFNGVDRARNRLVTAWRETVEPHTYRVSDFGNPELAFVSLAKSGTAYGPFDAERRAFGRTVLDVYSYAKWQRGFQRELAANSFIVFDYFHDKFGFEVEGPMNFVWTPTAYDARKVFGGSWVGGTVYEMKPFWRPAQRRNYEVLAHRIAHSLNREQPYGVKTQEPDESFFTEGWASYIELVALKRIERYRDHDGWGPLYARYLEQLAGNPGLDYLLADEPGMPGSKPDMVEFIHYTKAPIAVKLLSDEVFAATGGKFTLEDFWADVYRRYRGTGTALPLKQELEKLTGIDAAKFWCRVVDSPDILLPEWQLKAADVTVPQNAALVSATCKKLNGLFGAANEANQDCEPLLAEVLKRRPLLGQYLEQLPRPVLLQQLAAERRWDPSKCRVRATVE